MSYLNALDSDAGWTVVYLTLDGDNWAGPSSSIWIVPGTLHENARW
jgi:hypothetical protein